MKIKLSLVVLGFSIISGLSLQARLVDLTNVNPTIRFAMTRSHPSVRCCVIPEVAALLDAAQKELVQYGLCLKVFDAYRPKSEQEQELDWNCSQDDRDMCMQHARGTAVDVTLTLEDGTELPMPTEFDNFCPEARSDYMDLPDHMLKARSILKNVMRRYGFEMGSVWWHFDCTGLKTIMEMPEEMDIPFEMLG